MIKPGSMRFAAILATLLASNEVVGATPVYDFSPVTAQINALVQRESLDGASLVVMRNGATIYEHYFGNYTASTNIPIASASKWLSALTIERLVEQGKLHWSDTVGQYFPNAPAATRAVVSRADARSRMSLASDRSYLSRPVRSA